MNQTAPNADSGTVRTSEGFQLDMGAKAVVTEFIDWDQQFLSRGYAPPEEANVHGTPATWMGKSTGFGKHAHQKMGGPAPAPQPMLHVPDANAPRAAQMPGQAPQPVAQAQPHAPQQQPMQPAAVDGRNPMPFAMALLPMMGEMGHPLGVEAGYGGAQAAPAPAAPAPVAKSLDAGAGWIDWSGFEAHMSAMMSSDEDEPKEEPAAPPDDGPSPSTTTTTPMGRGTGGTLTYETEKSFATPMDALDHLMKGVLSIAQAPLEKGGGFSVGPRGGRRKRVGGKWVYEKDEKSAQGSLFGSDVMQTTSTKRREHQKTMRATAKKAKTAAAAKERSAKVARAQRVDADRRAGEKARAAGATASQARARKQQAAAGPKATMYVGSGLSTALDQITGPHGSPRAAGDVNKKALKEILGAQLTPQQAKRASKTMGVMEGVARDERLRLLQSHGVLHPKKLTDKGAKRAHQKLQDAAVTYRDARTQLEQKAKVGPSKALGGISHALRSKLASHGGSIEVGKPETLNGTTILDAHVRSPHIPKEVEDQDAGETRQAEQRLRTEMQTLGESIGASAEVFHSEKGFLNVRFTMQGTQKSMTIDTTHPEPLAAHDQFGRPLSKGLYSFRNAERETAMPEEYLYDYLCAFIEEAYEHECAEDAHKDLKADDHLKSMARAVMSELVQTIPQNPNLMRAAQKWSVTAASVAGMLTTRGIYKPKADSGWTDDHDSWVAMGAPVGEALALSLDHATADFDMHARPGLALAPRPVDDVATLVMKSEHSDPFADIRARESARVQALWDGGAEAIPEHIAANCPVHNGRDISKAQQLWNPMQPCTCGASPNPYG